MLPTDFTLAGDVSASQRYWSEDIIEHESESHLIGTIPVPTNPESMVCRKARSVDRLSVVPGMEGE